MFFAIRRHLLLVIFLTAIIIGVVWFTVRVTGKISLYQAPKTRQFPGRGSMPEETGISLQSVLDAEVNRLSLPGLQAGIQNAAGETWYGASGTVDPERRFPMSQDNILRIGSVTKTFTAVVILQLAEEGRLSLDSPLSLWFPRFPNAARVTIRDLLSHHSGIYNYLESPRVMVSLLSPHYRWQPQALIDIAAQGKPHAQEGYYYSNTNYVLLGLIAEQITGQVPAVLIRERISEPLGLENTYLVPNEGAPEALISGYDQDLIPFPGLFELKPDNMSAATAAFTSGAMVSTAEDLVLFYNGLFAGKLLTPVSLEAMTAFYNASDPGTPNLTGYGLGLFRLQIHDEEVWASLGEFIGSMTMVAYSPGEGDIVAIIGNLSHFDYISVWENLVNVSRKS